jgi:uncharacterized membrane protein (DUF373 family)
LTNAETAVYVGIGVLLLVAAAALLLTAAVEFAVAIGKEEIGERTLHMLNELLLVLMIVELFHTVRVSLREHTLVPEPFLIVGLIAGVRRVLVITAEAWHLGETDPSQFERAMIELALLTCMTLAIVVSIILLRRFRPSRS